MAEQYHKHFDKRVTRIVRERQRMDAAGSTPVLQKDGLIKMRARRLGLRFPIWILPAILLAAFGSKVALYNYLGPAEYAARLAALDPNDPVDKAGLFLMQEDPATLWVTERLTRRDFAAVVSDLRGSLPSFGAEDPEEEADTGLN